MVRMTSMDALETKIEKAQQQVSRAKKKYADADTSGRIDILIKYYPNFLRLVEGYEQSLSFIIKQEKEYKHRAS
ncbi:hypothetical protein [Butyrivibrio sp.]|uniref:hypothetical protein n=1 Tax=Butyrivibrio sp. TaxID=28121 RepID=UPI0025BBAAE9|nr:hypothetical protein [Butyrivibrio sp.]MBQ9305480.1 hypothetical protein [Butyrivibrio sp.]